MGWGVVWIKLNRPLVKAAGLSLAFDQSVTVDTRKFTVLRNDGVSLAGTLARGARLSQARLKPGSSNVTFGGTDATGRATCLFTWHPTFYSI